MTGYTVTYLVCPEFSSVSVERTVVVRLPQQGLDGEKDGADLETMILFSRKRKINYLETVQK